MERAMTAAARIALVTGGGSGIGQAAAQALAVDGWHVVLTGRRREALEAVAATGERFTVVPADVTDEASVCALFDEVGRHFGRLDLLFNNAGINAPAVPMDELPVERWTAVVATNLTGAFLCTRAAIGLMKRQDPRGGRIINNGSVSAHAPRLFSAPYTATKHALTGLTKATSLEGRAHDIACGQIDIGNAGTDLAARMGIGVPQADGRIATEPLMDVVHAGRLVATMASLPLDANVQFMTVTATKMPFIGRG